MAPSIALAAGVVLCLSSALANDGKDVGGGWKEKEKDGRVVQELKIEAPMMTEEDQYGYTMPPQYKCDSCKAVMFHLNKALINRHPKSRRMKDWEYTELFEETCIGAFEGYGIKLVNGKNKLSGPGLASEDQLAPGSGAIQMGGESWTKRLGEICRKTIFDKVGEDDFYEIYRETGGYEASICYDVTKDCTAEKLGPEVPPEPEKPRKVKKDKKTEPAKPKKTDKDKSSKAEKAPKQKSKEAVPKAAAASTQEASSSERLDLQGFFRQLATRHGFDSTEYLAARTKKDWEKLVVAMAGRIFNNMADKEGDGSCSA